MAMGLRGADLIKSERGVFVASGELHEYARFVADGPRVVTGPAAASPDSGRIRPRYHRATRRPGTR